MKQTSTRHPPPPAMSGTTPAAAIESQEYGHADAASNS